MNKNVGMADRLARAIVGVALLVFVVPLSPWGWLGLIPLATAALSWCPLYTLLGIQTCAAPTGTSDASK